MPFERDNERILRLLQVAYSLHKSLFDLKTVPGEPLDDLELIIGIALDTTLERLGEAFTTAGYVRPRYLHNLWMLQRYLVEFLHAFGESHMEPYYRIPFNMDDVQDFAPTEAMRVFYNIIKERLLPPPDAQP